MSQSTTTPATAARVRRRRMEPGRGRLLLASVMALLGGFLPWLYTAVGSVSGARGAGLWVAYAAMLGLAGALLPFRRAAAVQALVFAAVAVTLPLWQVVHLVDLVGFQGWTPGPGLVMSFGAGVLAALAARQLWPRPAEA
jgi:hypothetical protein